jgi:hypothetical protein
MKFETGLCISLTRKGVSKKKQHFFRAAIEKLTKEVCPKGGGADEKGSYSPAFLSLKQVCSEC